MTSLTGHLKSGTTSPAPMITTYLPKTMGTERLGLVIFPGGGYANLASHEGEGYARHFASQGIACFVVEYRLGPDGHSHPAMLEDALAAIGTIRERCEEFGISPEAIGVMGSSAGGHLAASAVTLWDSYESEVSLRPDFGVLCYPVITLTGPKVNIGSRNNLLGPDSSDEMRASLSCQNNVSESTPPCFLWHTWEDGGVPVENSLMFATALREHDVRFELHVYEKGRHGIGLGEDAGFSWAEDCLRWMKETVSQPRKQK